MPSLDLTSFDYALKQVYSRDRVYKDLYEDNPFLAMVPKDENFKGKNFVEAVIYGVSAGRSGAFATAQSQASAHKGLAFTGTRRRDYAVAKVDRETMLAAEGDPYALLEAASTEFDSALHQLKRSAAINVWGTGDGARGRCANDPTDAGGPITLTNKEDASNFEVGMIINANPNKTGNVGSMRAGDGTITAVDRDAGTISYSGTITGITTNDYLYCKGDYDAMIQGVEGWNPAAAPTGGDSWFGKDRSVDPVRLAGARFDGSTLNPEEALIKGSVSAARHGAKLTHGFLNPTDFANVDLSLGSKVRYEQYSVRIEGTEAAVGFSGLILKTPKGDIPFFSDVNCPVGVARITNLSTWKLRSLGALPQTVDEDGNTMLRISNEDGFEGRFAYYANLFNRAPGDTVRVKMPTA